MTPSVGLYIIIHTSAMATGVATMGRRKIERMIPLPRNGRFSTRASDTPRTSWSPVARTVKYTVSQSAFLNRSSSTKARLKLPSPMNSGAVTLLEPSAHPEARALGN